MTMQPPDTPELLPCPFCGGPAKISQPASTIYGRYFYSVGCPSCPDVELFDREEWSDGLLVLPEKECIERWNTRAQPAVDDALAQSTQSPVEQPPQTVAGDSFFDGKDYSAALGKIEYLLNQERQHLSFMTEENQPDYFLDPIKQDIASYEAAIELIKQAALTRHEGA